MSTNEARWLTRWSTPIVAAVIGICYLVAGFAGGDPAFGWFGLGLMLSVGLAFVLLSRRSEMVAGLADRRDERINAMDRDATLVAGMAVVLAVLVMFVVEIARGQDGSPYYQLGALGGVAYVAALVWLRLRR
jgi:uncharacterized membrane protein